jgi:hypothetical protein
MGCKQMYIISYHRSENAYFRTQLDDNDGHTIFPVLRRLANNISGKYIVNTAVVIRQISQWQLYTMHRIQKIVNIIRFPDIV